MNVSLKEFLKTGYLGELKLGMSEEHVRSLLGPPDAVGGTSRKYRRPSLWRYGSVEFYFTQSPPHVCHMIQIDWPGQKETYALPLGCDVEDCELCPGMRRTEVEAYLSSNEIAFKYDNRVRDGLRLVLLSSGVGLNLDDEERLWSIDHSLTASLLHAPH